MDKLSNKVGGRRIGLVDVQRCESAATTTTVATIEGKVGVLTHPAPTHVNKFVDELFIYNLLANFDAPTIRPQRCRSTPATAWHHHHAANLVAPARSSTRYMYPRGQHGEGLGSNALILGVPFKSFWIIARSVSTFSGANSPHAQRSAAASSVASAASRAAMSCSRRGCEWRQTIEPDTPFSLTTIPE